MSNRPHPLLRIDQPCRSIPPNDNARSGAPLIHGPNRCNTQHATCMQHATLIQHATFKQHASSRHKHATCNMCMHACMRACMRSCVDACVCACVDLCRGAIRRDKERTTGCTVNPSLQVRSAALIMHDRVHINPRCDQAVVILVHLVETLVVAASLPPFGLCIDMCILPLARKLQDL